ncbi:hypothetical protein TUBRATIS_16470 [Tubulinosema ratisbonensis]|uniref:Uncharacterized protein n=1 Tax=Tubulinosema ratisbonensis TaxID=291195 RepID=A0A437AL70_9MICR|nr:hypothetical protein TUBRATIS_16470 [Tubulinosema ratisbonensis]
MDNNLKKFNDEKEDVNEDNHKLLIEENNQNDLGIKYIKSSLDLQEIIIILRKNLAEENETFKRNNYERELGQLIFPFLIPCRRFLRRNRYISDVICPVLIIFMYLYLYQLICMITLEEHHPYLRFPCYINLSVVLFRTLLQFSSILPEFIAKDRIYWIDKSNIFIVFFNFAFLINCVIMLNNEFTNCFISIWTQLIIFCKNLFLTISYLPVNDLKYVLLFKLFLLVMYSICLLLFAIVISTDAIFIFYIFAEFLVLLINFISFLTLYEGRYWSDNVCFSILFSLHILFQIITKRLDYNYNAF